MVEFGRGSFRGLCRRRRRVTVPVGTAAQNGVHRGAEATAGTGHAMTKDAAADHDPALLAALGPELQMELPWPRIMAGVCIVLVALVMLVAGSISSRRAHHRNAFDACQRGDLQGLLMARTHGAIVDAAGRGLLHCAASSGNIQMLAYLISSRRGQWRQDRRGETPLHSCARSRLCQEDSLARLLATGPDLEAKDSIGRSAALASAELGRWTMVGQLADAGASLAAQDARGMTIQSWLPARCAEGDGGCEALRSRLEPAAPNKDAGRPPKPRAAAFSVVFDLDDARPVRERRRDQWHDS